MYQFHQSLHPFNGNQASKSVSVVISPKRNSANNKKYQNDSLSFMEKNEKAGRNHLDVK